MLSQHEEYVDARLIEWKLDAKEAGKTLMTAGMKKFGATILQIKHYVSYEIPDLFLSARKTSIIFVVLLTPPWRSHFQCVRLLWYCG